MEPCGLETISLKNLMWTKPQALYPLPCDLGSDSVEAATCSVGGSLLHGDLVFRGSFEFRRAKNGHSKNEKKP